jgi:hypothetical protein
MSNVRVLGLYFLFSQRNKINNTFMFFREPVHTAKIFIAMLARVA